MIFTEPTIFGSNALIMFSRITTLNAWLSCQTRFAYDLPQRFNPSVRRCFGRSQGRKSGGRHFGRGCKRRTSDVFGKMLSSGICRNATSEARSLQAVTRGRASGLQVRSRNARTQRDGCVGSRAETRAAIASSSSMQLVTFTRSRPLWHPSVRSCLLNPTLAAAASQTSDLEQVF
jgi:hypothetical protein